MELVRRFSIAHKGKNRSDRPARFGQNDWKPCDAGNIEQRCQTGSEGIQDRHGHHSGPAAGAGALPRRHPIGNLGDITIRALETLASADVLACEDTRVTRILLERYGIRTRPLAYHEHNANEAGPKLIAALEAGKSVALVSDAGTPLVSDPGYRLGQLALEAGHRVVPVPGASAPLAALVGSGMPSDAFLFAGFLPVKDRGKRDRFAGLAKIPATLIFFESPRRIGASLKVASEVLGRDRRAVVCRELTKTFEEFRRGTLGELADYYDGDRVVKGRSCCWWSRPPMMKFLISRMSRSS